MIVLASKWLLVRLLFLRSLFAQSVKSRRKWCEVDQTISELIGMKICLLTNEPEHRNHPLTRELAEHVQIRTAHYSTAHNCWNVQLKENIGPAAKASAICRDNRRFPLSNIRPADDALALAVLLRNLKGRSRSRRMNKRPAREANCESLWSNTRSILS